MDARSTAHLIQLMRTNTQHDIERLRHLIGMFCEERGIRVYAGKPIRELPVSDLLAFATLIGKIVKSGVEETSTTPKETS